MGCGTPEELSKIKSSYTGQFLRKFFNNIMTKNVHIIGGGLADELAYQLSLNKIFSYLYEMRPKVKLRPIKQIVCQN